MFISGLPFRDTALALSEEEVMQKLSIITVFTIANEQGELLLAQGENQKNVALLYISQQEAQKATQQLKQSNPQGNFQVLPVSLANIYQMVKQRNGQENTPLLDLIPVKKQVDAAMTLLRQQNQSVNEFAGVPLFYVTYQQEQQEVFLTAKNGEQSVIPLYLEKETLQNEIEKVRQQQPDIASTFQIRVMPLENLIGLYEKENNEAVRKMIVVPSQETLDFLRQLQQQQR
ncbi:Tic22 family protein [Gloeothece citriformis]|uniref:Tic22 family protein n=1 Tax=Gloeothece citriformis TaxID=2546356 RepID=UPI001EF145EC|nr:Tic22 family protein [Gloeothece citriformis]